MANCYNFNFQDDEFEGLNREYFDGEMGFAIDIMLYYVVSSDNIRG